MPDHAAIAAKKLIFKQLALSMLIAVATISPLLPAVWQTFVATDGDTRFTVLAFGL